MNTLKTIETPMKKVTIIWDEVRITFEASFSDSKEKYQSALRYTPENFSRREVLEQIKERVERFRGKLNFTSAKVWAFCQAEDQYYEDGKLVKSVDTEVFLFDGTLSEKKASDKPLDLAKLAEENAKSKPNRS